VDLQQPPAEPGGDQEETDRFFGVLAGTVRPAEPAPLRQAA
jgi:hypothetical protein